jgi:hypothetical protein
MKQDILKVERESYTAFFSFFLLRTYHLSSTAAHGRVEWGE